MNTLADHLQEVLDALLIFEVVVESLPVLERILDRLKLEKLDTKQSLAELRNDTQENKNIAVTLVWSGDANRMAAQKILIRNATSAIVNSVDFNLPEFKDKLISVVSMPGIIGVVPNAGSLSYTVQIYMDEYAGTVDEYAEIVSSIRRAFIYGQKVFGWASSLVNYIKLYLSAREGHIYWRRNKAGVRKYYPDESLKWAQFYWAIIRARLEEMENRAPFWYLIEHGNVGLSLASDKGGIVDPPYGGPTIPPSRFVAKSKMQINEYLTSKAIERYNILEEESLQLEKYYTNRLNLIQDGIETGNKLKTKLIRRKPSSTAKQRVRASLSEKRELANEILLGTTALSRLTSALLANDADLQRFTVKRDILINQILSGQITEGQRIYIGTFGGIVYRLRTTRLVKAIKEHTGSTLTLAEQRELDTNILKLKNNLRKLQ